MFVRIIFHFQPFSVEDLASKKRDKEKKKSKEHKHKKSKKKKKKHRSKHDRSGSRRRSRSRSRSSRKKHRKRYSELVSFSLSLSSFYSIYISGLKAGQIRHQEVEHLLVLLRLWDLTLKKGKGCSWRKTQMWSILLIRVRLFQRRYQFTRSVWIFCRDKLKKERIKFGKNTS